MKEMNVTVRPQSIVFTTAISDEDLACVTRKLQEFGVDVKAVSKIPCG